MSDTERAGKMLATLKPLSAAVNSLALGLYLCPPLPRIKENRFLKNKKAGGQNPSFQQVTFLFAK